MKTTVARALLVAVPLAAQALTSTASAQEFRPVMQSSSVGGDVSWWSAKNVGSVLPLVGFLHYGFSDNVFLDAQLPVATWLDGPDARDSKSRFGLGNPTIGAHYASTTDRLTWHAGGRISAPVGAVRDADWQLAMAGGGYATALYDYHLWTLNHLPIGGVFGLEYRVADPVVIRGNLDPTVYVPFSTPDVQQAKTLFIYQARVEVEGRSASGLGGGGALTMVHSVNEDILNNKRVQLSIEPFFSYDNGSLFARAGVLCALNDPLGFGFDQGKVLTLHGVIGAHL